MAVCRTRQVWWWVSGSRTSVVGVSVQNKCCGYQCTGQRCGCQCAGQVLGVSVSRTSVVGVSLQDECGGCQCAGQVLGVSVCRTSVVGVSVQSCMVVCKGGRGEGVFAERKRVCCTHVLLLAGRCEPIWGSQSSAGPGIKPAD